MKDTGKMKSMMQKMMGMMGEMMGMINMTESKDDSMMNEEMPQDQTETRQKVIEKIGEKAKTY